MGYEEARVSRRIWPEADQRKTSICPGVSTITYLASEWTVMVHTHSLGLVFR